MDELRHFAKVDAGEPRRAVDTIFATIVVANIVVVLTIIIFAASNIVVAIIVLTAISIRVASPSSSPPLWSPPS